MAMGGYNKGNYGSRGRPYGLMLLLAFGAALFGVMVVHKFREKRIFNLLIKEKDRDILSLQHLLQKERDHTKETKKKTEVMRVKIYSLRSQKMELDNAIREMQSTISSLKDEHRMLESALEESQKEIRMLRKKDSSDDNSQEAYLDGILKQKDAEIEELKRRLETRVKLGWGQTIDPSSYQLVNSTSASSEKQEGKRDIVDIENNNTLSKTTDTLNGGDQSVNIVIGDGTKLKTEAGAENVVEATNGMDLILKSQKQGNNSDENPTDHGNADQSNGTQLQGTNNNESQRSFVEGDGKNPNGENMILDARDISRDKEENVDVQTMGTEEVRRKNLEEDVKVERGTSQAGFGELEMEPSNILSTNVLSSSPTDRSMFASAGKKKGKKSRVVSRKWRVEHEAALETKEAVFAEDRKSSGDAIGTKNREVLGVRLHESTARIRHRGQSRLSKANKSDQIEDGMQENSKPVLLDDLVEEDGDQTEFKSKTAPNEEMMSGESSTNSKEDTREVDKPSDSLDGKLLLELETSKRTEDLKGSATNVVQRDQEEKGDITLETSSDSDEVELPMNRRFNGNQGDNLTGGVHKPDTDVGIRPGVEQEADAMQEERNKLETFG